MADARRIEEALTHIRAAEKSLKTSLLKWQPDYEIACDQYQQAATCYRNAKRYDECRATLMKAADCHLQTRSLFHAAKCFEQVILMMREQGSLDEIEPMAHRACRLYQQQGSPEAGAAALDKAAKIVEQRLPEHALQLYRHALEVVQLEDHGRQAQEYASKVARLLVRLQRYDEAAEAVLAEMRLGVQTQQPGLVGRLCVALVLVQLARDDAVAAEKAFREWSGYCDGSEVNTLEQLIGALDEEDAEAARRALKSPFILHMDVEYARLARDMKLPEGIGEVKASEKQTKAEAAKSSVFDDEEEEEVAQVLKEVKKPVEKPVPVPDATEEVREQLAKKSMLEDEEEEEDGSKVGEAAAAPKSVAKPPVEEDDDDDLC